MARKYPNDFTPDGVDIETAFANDDLELKDILSQIANVGAINLSGEKRQSVLSAHADSSGNPDYITATGLNVSIDGSTTPVILAFAAGFDDKGSVDLVDAIKTNVSAWTVPSNATVYLYVDKDASTGLLSYGYTSLADLYQKAAPTATLDQHWYDTNACKMKRYNGSAWEEKRRVFVGKVVSGASTAAVTIYPLTSKAAPVDSLTRLSNTSYSVGDIALSSSLPKWARLECVVAGTTGATEPSYGTTAGVYVTDGTVKWIIDDVRDMTPIGRPIHDLFLRTGYVKLNGATVNRADYPRLWNLANSNNLFYDGLTITGTTTASSATISGISTADIAKLVVGMTITGTGIPANTTITAVSTSSITISANATASGTATITYGNTTNFPGLFGKGDGSTTFVLPDFRGVSIRSLDDGKGLDIDGSKRISGSYQGDAVGPHTHIIPCGQSSTGGVSNLNGSSNSTFYPTQPSTGTETRDKNIALIAQCKY